MRLNRHDYDLLYMVYAGKTIPRGRRWTDQTEKLSRLGCLAESQDGSTVRITAYGRAQLQRVRGVGLAVGRVPPGYVLVPRRATPEMLEAARANGPVFNALSYGDLLRAAPRLKL